MTKDLLWEIGLEEMPARFLPPAIKQMGELAAECFGNAGLSYEKLEVYATPRRLTLLVNGLAEKAADLETEVKGPARKAAYDENGQPTRALLGFCKGQGVDMADLQEKELNGNIYIFAKKKSVGQPTIELLPQILLTTVEKLYFPKPMRWGYNTLRFARPVRWLIALFGTDIINVSFGGVQADRYSRGHRLLGSDHIEISEPAAYKEALRANYVIVDQAERQELCRQQINQVAASFGGHVKEDSELLEEVTYLIEYPTALAGHFEEKYLAIPEELVTTPMVDQQRYFPVYGSDDKLLNRFITVRNGDSRHLDIVAEGNEKVLRARLADAEFFYTEDLKDKMDDKVEELSAVVFHEKLGTVRQKVDRIIKISEYIGKVLNYSEADLAATRRAAYLAKADLGSRVVYEFPELQGIIGEYYALAAGEDKQVAQAIREHYLPRFAGDELPETKAGIAVALADKLDSIAGFFAMGIIPSGSQDPYALRRAAAGCVQIVIRHQIKLAFSGVLLYAFELIKADAASYEQEKTAERIAGVIAFLDQRAENILSEEGENYDVINAVHGSDAAASGDIMAMVRRARAIQAFRSRQAFGAMLAALTRAGNIIHSSKDSIGKQIDTSLLRDAAEKDLYAKLEAAEKAAGPALAADDLSKVLELLAGLAPSINNFFEAVMVNDPNAAIRGNRQALLRRILAISEQIGDFSKIVE